jgi:hypothetical protein
MPVDSTLADPTAEPNTWKATVLDPWVADVSATFATLEAGGSDTANVMAHGAIGDGTSNTIAAVYGTVAAAVAANPTWAPIQGDLTTSNQIDEAAYYAARYAVGNGSVYFPAGNYRKTEPWPLTVYQSIDGDGLNVTFIEDFGSDGITLTWSGVAGENDMHCRVQNLTLRRDASVGTAAAGSGIKFASAGLGVANCVIDRVRVTGYNVAIDAREGEQNSFRRCSIDTCVTGVWIEGSGSGTASNYNRFENCTISGCSYQVRFGSYTYKNLFFQCAFYGATTAAVYAPAALTGCSANAFEDCWWEVNTAENDLRSGVGFLFMRPILADDLPFIVTATYGATATRIIDPLDLSNTGQMMPNFASVSVQHINPNSELNFYAQHGTGHSSHRDGTHITNLVAEGLAAGRSLAMPGWSAGAGEANRLSSGTVTGWTVSGTITGTIADPLGGTAAYRLAVNGQALTNWASGSALTGRTITWQMWAKSNGGRLQIGMGDNVAVDSSKTISLPRNQWQLCHFTYTFPTATGTTLYVFMKGLDAAVDVYWPVMSESATVTAALPYGRDLTAWTQPYEIKGPNHTVHTWGTAAPGSGTWAVGDVVLNTAPAASGTIGWICTTGGSPGTWKTFGAIAA